MENALYLIIDQGGHSTRAIIFDANGVVQCQSQVAVETQVLQPGWVEQDPQYIVHSVSLVLVAIAQQLGDRCKQVNSAGLIVQRSSLVAWDKHTGNALHPVLSWQDTRNSDWLEQRIAGQHHVLRSLTGLHPNAHYGASKMRWLLDHVPAVQQAADAGVLCLSPLASFLHWHLLHDGQSLANVMPVVDAVIASRTLLTETGALQWSATLLDLFNIPESVLPVIKPTIADYSVLALGDARVPLKLLGGDQSFFALAWGDMAPDTVYINVGTGAFLQQAMASERVPQALLASALKIQPDHVLCVAEGTVNAAASALDWLWQQRGMALTPAQLEQALLDSKPDGVPLFQSRMVASGSPDWLPAGESTFSFEAPLPMQAVAVLDAIVYALQRNLDCLRAAAPCRRIVISGGLSKLDGFCRRLEALAGVPVLRSEDAEASARGAMMQLLDR